MNNRQYQFTEAGAVQAPPHAHANNQRYQYQHEVVTDIRQLTNLHHTEHHIRVGDIQRVDAPDLLGEVFHDQKQGEGDQHQQHLITAIEHAE